MLRQQLGVLQRTLFRTGALRASRQVLPGLPRRKSVLPCSQREDFPCAIRPVIAASRTCCNAHATDVGAHTAVDTNGASEPKVIGDRKLTFQEAITALEQYWAKQSGVECAILLPHNTEVRPVHVVSRLLCACKVIYMLVMPYL